MCKVNLLGMIVLVSIKYLKGFVAMLFPSFTFNYNNNCYLKESAKLSNMNESTAGWCPKGITYRNNIWRHTDNNIDFI